MKRYKPSATRQADLLTEWQNRCAYCRLPFGTLVWRRGIGSMRTSMTGTRRYAPNFAAISLIVEWDHFIPFTYTESSGDGQFLPACQLCNRLKTSSVYRTVEGVRESIEPRWVNRYELADGPVRSFQEAQKRESDAA